MHVDSPSYARQIGSVPDKLYDSEVFVLMNVDQAKWNARVRNDLFEGIVMSKHLILLKSRDMHLFFVRLPLQSDTEMLV